MDLQEHELQESVDDSSSGGVNMFWVSPNHTIPGVLFALWGLFVLLFSLYWARKLNPGQSFCELHVPERNYKLMNKLSLAAFTVFLIVLFRLPIYHCTISISGDYLQCFFHNWEHTAMYSSYGLICLVALLECKGRLPIDSARRALSLCHFLNYIIVNDHAMMKPKAIDRDTHELWAQVELVSSIVVAYSVYNPFDIFSYLSIWGMFVLKGIWVVTTGIQLEMDILAQMDVGAVPLFVSEVVLVAVSIAVIAAFFGNVNYQYDLAARLQQLPHHHHLVGNSSSNDNNTSRRNKATTDALDYECVKLSDDENL